jgi:hypothetical protein
MQGSGHAVLQAELGVRGAVRVWLVAQGQGRPVGLDAHGFDVVGRCQLRVQGDGRVDRRMGVPTRRMRLDGDGVHAQRFARFAQVFHHLQRLAVGCQAGEEAALAFHDAARTGQPQA